MDLWVGDLGSMCRVDDSKDSMHYLTMEVEKVSVR